MGEFLYKTFMHQFWTFDLDEVLFFFEEYYILVIFKVNYTSSSLYPITIYSL